MKCGDSTIAIRDDDLYNNWDSNFIKYLNENGFKYGGRKGYFGGNIIFVNLNSKRYAFLWPGVGFTEPIAHKCISIKDFKTIYNIFEKY
jgi:hypothetical protein